MPSFSRFFALLLSLSLALVLSSCQLVFQSLYGMRGIRPVPEPELQQLAKRFHIPPIQLAVLDTSYRQFLARLHPQDSVAAKNHYQPLQASYYNRAGQLQVFYINCYAGGFPNLVWNRKGALNQFLPAPQAPVDTALALADYLRYVRQPDGQALQPPAATNYTVVVQWNRFMSRQSKRLVREVQRNAALAGNSHSVQLLFVNTDNLWAYMTAREARWEQAHKPQ